MRLRRRSLWHWTDTQRTATAPPSPFLSRFVFQVLENRKDDPETAEDEHQRRKRIWMGNDPFLGAIPGTELFKRQHFTILKLAAEEQARVLAAQAAALQLDAEYPAAQQQTQQAVPAQTGPAVPPAASVRDSRGPSSGLLAAHVLPAHDPGSLPVGNAPQRQENGSQPVPGPATPLQAEGAQPPVRGTSRKLEYTNCAPTNPPRAGFDLQILGGAIVGQALLAVAHDWVTGGQPANLRIQWQRCDVRRVEAQRLLPARHQPSWKCPNSVKEVGKAA